jgi:hypothetical protein
MRLGIVVRADQIGKIIPGDEINYMDYIMEDFRKKFQIVMFDWRDISEDLIVSRSFIGTAGGVKEDTSPRELNGLCDFIFIKQLGKVYAQREEFLSFLESLKKFEGIILNPLDTIKNNFSKKYLLDLQEKGLPVVPTMVLREDVTLETAKKVEFSFPHCSGKPEDYVVKPMKFGEMGAAVKRISEFESEEEFQEYLEANSPVLFQPFISDILANGENSLIFLGKEFTHAIRKFSGKFKVNCGLLKTNYKSYEPSDCELEICNNIYDSWEDELGYWRVDFIYVDGKPLISEVEAANPALYPENYPKIAEEFTRKLEKYLEGYYESKING